MSHPCQESHPRPWASLRLALHEARSPLTVIAYASELLLESPRPQEPRVARQHLEAIHRAAQEAAACLHLVSRAIEVEHAGHEPRPEAVPLEAFRDPDAPDHGPALDPDSVVHLDPRLARHLSSCLWEMAALSPKPRPRLVSVSVRDGSLALQLQGPGAFLDALDPASAKAPSPARRTAAPIPPFASRFRADILLRALELLGGRAVPSDAPGSASDLVLLIPDNAPAPRRRRAPR